MIERFLDCAFFFLDIPEFLNLFVAFIPNLEFSQLKMPEISLFSQVFVENLQLLFQNKTKSIFDSLKGLILKIIYIILIVFSFTFLPFVFGIIGLLYNIKKGSLKEKEEQVKQFTVPIEELQEIKPSDFMTGKLQNQNKMKPKRPLSKSHNSIQTQNYFFLEKDDN